MAVDSCHLFYLLRCWKGAGPTEKSMPNIYWNEGLDAFKASVFPQNLHIYIRMCACVFWICWIFFPEHNQKHSSWLPGKLKLWFWLISK